MKESRITRALDAISQLGNVLLYDGNQNHSISGDAWRFERKYMEAFANFLFRSKEHCREAHLKDVFLADQLINSTPTHLIEEARQLFAKD